jgi:hypothetical protein
MAILLGNIAAAQGDGTDMSRSENTNKWSRRKWVRYNTRSKLTDAQMKEVNFGFEIPAYTSGTIPRLQDNRLWKYLQPRKGTDPSRMGDMEGYDHYAQSKFLKIIPSYSNNNAYIKESLILSMETLEDGGNAATSVKLSELKANNLNNYYSLNGLPIVFLFINEAKTGSYLDPSYVVYTGQTFGDTVERNSLHIEWATLNTGLPSEMTDGSKWRCAAFCCTKTPTFTPLKFYAYSTYDLGYLIPLTMNEKNLNTSEIVLNVYEATPLPAQGMYGFSAGFSLTDWRVEMLTLRCTGYDVANVQMKFELVVKNPSWPVSSPEKVIGSHSNTAVAGTWSQVSGSSLYGLTVGSAAMTPNYSSNYSSVYNPANGDKLYVRVYMKQAGSGTSYGQSIDVDLKTY